MKKIISYILISLIIFAGSATLFAPDVAFAETNAGNGAIVNASPNLNCSILKWDFEGCIALAGYYAFYIPSAWILIIAGAIFDTMLAFSLNSANTDQAFVLEAWKIVRDVANLFFIFILLYIAIGTILQTGGDNLKKALINVIIVGLVINFSFFFTRIVIDASNIFAMEFYTKIGSITESPHTGPTVKIPERSISAGFVDAFNPQKMINSDTFNQWTSDGHSKSVLFMLFLSGAIMNIFASYVFFLSGFLMVTRVLAFMFLIIASPLAFMAYIVPNKSSYATKWWTELSNQAFMAPIFLFFLYVITSMIVGVGGTGFIDNVFADATDLVDVMISMVLQGSVVILGLLMALKVAKKLSGEAGAFVGGIEKKLKGSATGGASLAKAGAGFVATQTAGRLASKAAEKLRGEDGFASRNPFMGALATGALDKLGGKKYDKWTSDQTKKTTAAGARAAAPTAADKAPGIKKENDLKKKVTDRKKELQKAKALFRNTGRGQREAEEAEKDLRIAEMEYSSEMSKLDKEEKKLFKEIGDARKAQFMSNLSSGSMSKIIGTDKINREAAKKVRAGDDGSGSTLEKLIQKLQAEAKKDIEGEAKAASAKEDYKA